VGLWPFACWDCEFESCQGHVCLSLVSVVCCQVEVSATSWSLVQRSPAECGVSECDREASIMRRTWPTRDCCAMKRNSVISKLMQLPYCRSIVTEDPCITDKAEIFLKEIRMALAQGLA
jgi:hypothetical protein